MNLLLIEVVDNSLLLDFFLLGTPLEFVTDRALFFSAATLDVLLHKKSGLEQQQILAKSNKPCSIGDWRQEFVMVTLLLQHSSGHFLVNAFAAHYAHLVRWQNHGPKTGVE